MNARTPVYIQSIHDQLFHHEFFFQIKVPHLPFLFQALLKISYGNVDSGVSMPICLPDSPDLQTHSFRRDTCFTTGYGSTDTGGYGSTYTGGSIVTGLRETHTPVLDTGICSRAYNTSQFGHVKIRDSHLCAGHVDGSAGTCVVSKQVVHVLKKLLMN